MHRILQPWVIIFALVSGGANTALRAQEQPAWLDEQSVIVARLSVQQAESNVALLDMLAHSAKPVSNELQLWKEQLKNVNQTVKAAGGSEVLIVYSLADAFTDQPFLVFPGSQNIKPGVLTSTFLGNGLLNVLRKAQNYGATTIGNDFVAATPKTLARLNAKKNNTGKAGSPLLNRPAGENPMSVTATLNKDQRRAISEMTNELPKFLGGGMVRDLLGEIEAIQINVGKDQTLAFTLIGNHDAIVARVKTIQTSLTNDEKLAANSRSTLGKYLVDQVVKQTPKRDGESLTWTFSLSELMQSEFGSLVSNAMLESDQLTANYRLMQLGLGMHNYYSAFRKLPGVDTVAGKPRKLSWRVDLLPFMDETDLWKEFHLDEAWDSEHNKKLIPRMPEVFRCPQSKHAQSSGLSTFVLPVHEKAMWSKSRETEFRDVEDGTSNTIMTVEVRDELAQIWTKPDPFEVDLEAPEKQFGGHFEGKILFGRGDGSVSVMSQFDFKSLPALITRAGGEVTEF